MSDTHSLDTLIQALRRLPGVGQRSAQRMAFHLLQHDREGAQQLARALHEAVGQVRHCARCHTFTEAEVCATCSDPRRDASQLAVVETPADQAALERTGAFRGRYFVLMGRLSPLDGIGPRDIGVQRLIERACDGVVREVIPFFQIRYICYRLYTLNTTRIYSDFSVREFFCAIIAL